MSSPNNLYVPLSDNFVLPTNNDIGANAPGVDAQKRCTYLCGNSLGPLCKRSEKLINEEIRAWGTRAVEGHFAHPFGRDWVTITDHVVPLLADIVGAKEKEVACMGTLTANLHLMMSTFYKPTTDRFKILCESKAFPSDQYAFVSQVASHGLDPATAILELSPREGEHALREEDILETIASEGPTIALVLLSGVQYYTGQWFPMQSITRKAKEQGCICGWDLAHAVGNVPLALHDWDVDFAVWCTYKYLNSGPGGIAGLFIHEKWDEKEPPKFTGWWGHDLSTRFAMPAKFNPIKGAQGYQQSNPSALAIVALLGSLENFKEAGMMSHIRRRSVELTGALEGLLSRSNYFVRVQDVAERYDQTPEGLAHESQKPAFTIITPEDPDSRGAQLSLVFLPMGKGVMSKVFPELAKHGVIGDKREPDVIRLAPAPLYNTLADCERAAACLDVVLGTLNLG